MREEEDCGLRVVESERVMLWVGERRVECAECARSITCSLVENAVDQTLVLAPLPLHRKSPQSLKRNNDAGIALSRNHGLVTSHTPPLVHPVPFSSPRSLPLLLLPPSLPQAPSTGLGKGLTVFWMLFGIICFGIFTGAIAAQVVDPPPPPPSHVRCLRWDM